MAYAATVEIVREGSRGLVVTVTETEAAAASEKEIVDTTTGFRPGPCRLRRCIAPPLSAGSAATRQPRLAVAAAATAGQVRYTATSTAVASTIDETMTVPVTLEGKLYHRSQVNAGADNSMVTVYHLITGWTD